MDESFGPGNPAMSCCAVLCHVGFVCRVFSILKKNLRNFVIVSEMGGLSQQQTNLKHEYFDEFVDL
jgi:hypothetical protein